MFALRFLGAAQTVTGSSFLLRTRGRRTLILTHAHIDHSGYLPRLVKDGFRGPIYCSRASGTLAGGRILHHLEHRLPDHRNTVLFVGYQPQGSLGRMLIEGRKEVKIHGGRVKVRARIVALDALSAHADSEEILAWMQGFDRFPSHIFLVHGETGAQEALPEKLRRVVPSQICIPQHLQRFDLEKL